MELTGKTHEMNCMGRALRFCNQKSRDWTHLYEYEHNGSTLSSAGCGIFALAHAVEWMHGIRLDPDRVAEISVAVGGRGDDGTDRPAMLHGMMANGFAASCGFRYEEPEGEDLWIDLSEFGYGHSMLDIAMWYFLTRLNPEELVQHLFHMGLAETARVWDLFVEEYADARSPEEKLAFEQQVRPYAALHMIYLGVNVGFKPGLMDRIREILKACKMIP